MEQVKKGERAWDDLGFRSIGVVAFVGLGAVGVGFLVIGELVIGAILVVMAALRLSLLFFRKTY